MINSKNQNRLLTLRQRAELALKNGEIALEKLPHDQFVDDTRKLIEEFRIYQAELELQNEELNRSQFETQQALARYRILFESLPLAGLVLDCYGVIEDMNMQASDLFGFNTTSKLFKHSFYRLIAKEDRTRILEVLRVDSTSQSTTMLQDIKVRDRNNDFVVMDGHLIHLPIDYHLENYILLLLVDRSAEAAREHDRLLFQSMLDNSPSIMTAFDEMGRCMLANTAMLKFANLPAGLVLGQTRELWQNSEDAKKCQEKDYEVISTGNPALEEEQLFSVLDNFKHFYISNRFPLRDKRGEIFGVGLVQTDISTIKEIEARLQLAMQVFSQGSEGIIITDENNLIISVNKAFERISGYKEAEVLNKNPSMFASGKQDKSFYVHMWDELLTKHEWEGELINRRKNGESYPLYLNVSRVCISPALDEQTKTIYHIAIFNDITTRKRIENEIHQLAFYDPLTKTPNRHLLRDRACKAIDVARRENSQLCLVFLDLDHFKEVNDTLGHAAGDELLIEVSQRIESKVRDEDTICRFGGDEFILLLNGINEENAALKAKVILSSILQPYTIQNEIITLSASMGIAMYPKDGGTFEMLLKNADTAMYHAKESGRNAFSAFFMKK